MISLYHDTPGTVPAETSAAAMPAPADAARLREQCLMLLQQHDLTADECAELLKKNILSVRPRCAELRARGLISDSGRRRKNSSGHAAIVWTTKPQHQPGGHEP